MYELVLEAPIAGNKAAIPNYFRSTLKPVRFLSSSGGYYATENTKYKVPVRDAVVEYSSEVTEEDFVQKRVF
ncbi:hypothetical protein VTI74DRAFT_7028 [Chaetomium olivicolor]